LPPLRERSEDIPLLAKQLLSQQVPQVGITDEALALLQQYTWPGNIRELKNMLLAAAAYTQSQFITAVDLPDMLTRTAVSEDSKSRRQVLDRTEADLIRQALQQAGSVAQAALRLGLHDATLYRKLKKYRIPLLQSQKKH
jgi:transcriptional regulator with PAS, ATPase and Fis domain